MTILIVKATIAMMLALLLVSALRRAKASLRHLVLASLFAFLLLLPLVQRFAPQVDVAVQETTVTKSVLGSGALQPAQVSRDPGGRSGRRSTGVGLLQIYLGGAGLLLSWLAIGVLRLRRLADDGEVWLDGTAAMNAIAADANIRRSALVVLSNKVDVPLTFGFRRSTIVLPFAARHWNADELTRPQRHELEHVRREDWLL